MGATGVLQMERPGVLPAQTHIQLTRCWNQLVHPNRVPRLLHDELRLLHDKNMFFKHYTNVNVPPPATRTL